MQSKIPEILACRNGHLLSAPADSMLYILMMTKEAAARALLSVVRNDPCLLGRFEVVGAGAVCYWGLAGNEECPCCLVDCIHPTLPIAGRQRPLGE